MVSSPAIIFDLDDTLYPEWQYVLSGFRAVASWADVQLGIPPEEGFRELAALFHQGVRRDTFDRWLSARRVDPRPHMQEMVRVYRHHPPRICPYADVRPALEALRLGARLGLLTDGPAESQRRKLASLRLGGFLDAVIVADEFGRAAWKPSPFAFEAALAALNVPASAATYVADNPVKDFLGARRLGMRTVRIRRGDGLYAHLEPPSAEHAPDAEIQRLIHVEAALLQ